MRLLRNGKVVKMRVCYRKSFKYSTTQGFVTHRERVKHILQKQVRIYVHRDPDNNKCRESASGFEESCFYFSKMLNDVEYVRKLKTYITCKYR